MPQSTYRVTTEDGAYDVTVDEPDTPQPTQATAMQLRGGRGTGLDVRKSDAAAPYLLTGAMMAAPVAGIARAAVGGGVAAAGRAALPYVAAAGKYEVVKAGLRAAGVPAVIADPIAIAVSGYRRGGTPAAAAEAEAATGASAVKPVGAAAPAELPPATPTVPAASTARVSPPSPTAAQKWSPQQIRNEVGLAERRAGLKLTEQQRAAADQLVAQGHDPKDVMQALAKTVPPVAKPKLSAAETKVYTGLRIGGVSHDEAMTAIQQQRDLASKFGLPSYEQVRERVATRNATGRWEKP